jgi:hypothetical protein
LSRHHRPARAALASLSVVALALLGAVPASAFGLSIDSTILTGPGPTTWDLSTSVSACSSGTGDSPIDDGQFATRTDGFDDGLMISINGSTYADYDGIADISGNTASTWGGTYSGVAVSEQITSFSSSPTERLLVKFQNSSKKSHSLDIEMDSNVGSDTSTEIVATSSGDKKNTLADRWIISNDGAPTTGDPIVTHVLFGKGAAVTPKNLSAKISTGLDCETLHYTVKVPAGKSRYLLFFVQMHGSDKTAVSGASPFNSLSSGSSLLNGISKATQSQIVNWHL